MSYVWESSDYDRNKIEANRHVFGRECAEALRGTGLRYRYEDHFFGEFAADPHAPTGEHLFIKVEDYEHHTPTEAYVICEALDEVVKRYR